MPDFDLESWSALRDLARGQLLGRIGAGPADVHPGVAYEGIAPVDRVHAAGHPGHFYFAGDRLALIYSGVLDQEGLGPVLEQQLGGEGQILRSRAGRRSKMHVYAERGVAFSSDGDMVQFVELFPPTTFERYRADVYREPGEFIQ